MNIRTSLLNAVCTAVLLSGQPSKADFIVVTVSELTANDGSASHGFGASIALSKDGTRALLGSPGDDQGWAQNAGSAYLFERVGGQWLQQAKLVADDGSTNDWFGNSVALSGNGMLALVGAPGNHIVGESGYGSVYVFEKAGTNWTLQAKLRPSVVTAWFGTEVALAADGSFALVSAGSNSCVFLRDGSSWIEQARLPCVGDAVALDGDGDTALIGFWGDDIYVGLDPWGNPRINQDQGSASVFRREGSNWIHEAKLLYSHGASRDQFGNAVALTSDGNTALVGAYYSADGKGGVACIFARNGTNWMQQAVLIRPTSINTHIALFAYDVAISSNGLVASIGDYFCDTPRGVRFGAGWIFSRAGNSWKNQAQLYQDTGAAVDRFGQCVALSADGLVALVGAPGHATAGGAEAGAAYLFQLIEAPEGYNHLTATRLEDNCVRLGYVGLPGTNYVLESSPAIVPAVWNSLFTNTAPADGVMAFTNSPAQGSNQFWRMRTGP